MAIPTLIDLIVSGSSVALRYSEALSSTLPSFNRFIVKVNGKRVYATGPATLSADGTTILLNLANPVAVGASVTLTYSSVNGAEKPGFGDIKSRATGQKVAFLRDSSVINRTLALAPTLAISSSASSLKAGETATITFSFSEIPSGFNAADIATSGGSLSGLVVSSDPKIYTAIFTPTAGSSGTASISVAAGLYSDAAGNAGAGGSSGLISFDTLAPTLAISSSASSLKAGETATITFSFSEIPSGFNAADIATSGGSLSGLVVSSDPKIYTAIFTPTAGSSGTASISVAAGLYSDAAGNAGAGGSSGLISFDTLAPTLAISSSASSLKAGETATITFSFSEIPSGFNAADIATSGGSLSGLVVSSDPKIYTAIFTPTAGSSGTASISVAPGLYSDVAGNAGAGGSSGLISFDTLAPTLAISSSASSLKAGETATITFSFSEIPSGFNAADIATSGGSLSGLVVSSDPKIYTAIFTPTAGSSGTASISVAPGLYSDVAGNAGAGGSSGLISFDTLAPTLAISSSASSLKAGETATITFSFSEIPSGFNAADIATSGGSLSGLVVSSDPKIYTAIFTPTAGSSGTASISVAAGLYSDAAGNAGAGGSSGLISFDTLAPTLAISSSASSLKAGETATITFSFSEIPSGFNAADIATSGGSLSGLVVSSDPKIYTTIFTPTAGSSGTASISVAAGLYSDAAGNAGAGGSSGLISFDTLAPTLAISSSASSLKAGETATITFSFSEIPSGFNAADIATSGGSLSGLVVSSDPKIYTAIFTPTAGSSGTASISVAAGLYSDAAGNAGAGGSSGLISFDTLAPTLAISSSASSLKAGETATITFSFSEIPSGFNAADIATSGGSLSGLVVSSDPKIYTTIFTPTAGSSGTASISVAAGLYSDAAGNAGAGGSSGLISFDTLAPTLAISSSASSLKAGETATITFSFSEIPSGFNAADIATSGGSLSGLVVSSDPKIYTAIFTPTAGSSGTASISVAAGLYSDMAGNAGAGGSSGLISFDTLAPTLAISSSASSLKAGETATITFSFSEIPSGFNAADIATSGGSLSGLIVSSDPKIYTAIFTPTAGSSGTASISVAAGLYSDAAGNNTVTPAGLQINLESGLVSLSVGLSASTDTGTRGDGITSLSRVSLIGQGQGGDTVSLRGTALRAVISGDGAFQLTEVPLETGDNILTLDLLDGNGNSVASRELALTLEAPAGGTSPEDPVLAWNRVALEAIRRDATLPTNATRGLAMQAIAVLDTLAAIDGTPAFLVGLDAPAGVPAGAAVAAASARVLSYLYPSQKNLFLEKRDSDLQAYKDDAARQTAVELGEGVADVVIALRDNDGWNRFDVEDVGNQPGQWRPTPPAFDLPQAPHWAQLTPFSLQSGSQFRPDEPPALTSAAYAEALNEVKNLGSATSSTRTAEQTQIARFWADGLGSYTPPGHWNQIADQQAAADGFGYGSAARLLAILNVALADSSIASWDAKYAYDLWRPVTAIRNADSDGNPETTAQSDWQPLLITPNHPEYVSGHSTYSAAAAEVLTQILGDRAFDTTSIGLPNVSRSFSSFEDAAAEAGRSRIYGGIHYELSNQAGQALGTDVALWVLDAFRTDIDLRGPQLALQQASGQVWSNAPLLSGFAVDNLSGVKSLSVTLAGLDPKLLSVDERGRFSLDVGTLFGSLADGGYGLTFQAEDGAGNLSAPLQYSFQLDNTAPTLAITSLSDGGLLEAGARLIGSVDGTGTPVQSLSYSFNNGVARPLVFDSTTGAFDVPLSLGSLATGDQILTLTAQDGAGLSTTTRLTLRLPEAIPLTIEAVSPADGTGEVGATFRPQVSFSRPVDPGTVTGDSFWATDAAGNRLPATIVMAPQGNRAWLLFDGALPGSTRINLLLDGSKIRAAGDGQFLDADGDGTPGGSWNSAFTTVNLTPVAGTTLVGKVVGPGADLKPMSYDDFRAGPDGAAHTADDVFLEPLAGVKVFILGLEDRAVFTDAQGRFELKDVPVGVVKVAIDGRTATNPPTDVFYPEMVMDVTIRPAQVNTIMGTMGTTQEQLENFSRQEVYLPRISTKVLTAISTDQPTTVTTPAEGASNLTEQQRQLIQLVVQPGSVIGENGQVLDNAKVGIATVPPELVRDMLPPGLLQHTFDLTIQAPGAAVFNTPLQLTLPNVFNAPPGTKLNLLSFDHTTGRLVIDGTGTVSVDGEFVVTDPDSGITRPGWHGMTPPGSDTSNSPPPPPPCKEESGLDKAKFYSQLAKDLLKCASELTTGKIGKLLKIAATLSECADEGLEIAKRVRDLAAAIDRGATEEAVLNAIGAIRGAKGVFEAKAPGVIKDATSTINQAKAVLTCAALLASQANEACKGAVDDIKCNPGTGTWGAARDFALRGLCTALSVLNSAVAGFERAVDLAQDQVGKFLVGVLCEGVRAGLDAAEIWARKPSNSSLAVVLLQDNPVQGGEQHSVSTLSRDDVVKALNDAAGLGSAIASEGLLGSNMVLRVTKDIEAGMDVFGYSGIVGHIGELSQLMLGLPGGAPYLVEIPGGDIRGRTGANGQIDVFLPPSAPFSLSIYDPTYNLVAHHEGVTSPSGVPTTIRSVPYLSSFGEVDTDNDGLIDLAEHILGTSLTKFDTDGDRISDLAEVKAGQDPLGGFSLNTGVVGSLALQGQALDLVLATDPANPTSRLALVATGNGISVVDLSNDLSPSVVASLRLNGNADSVAYDPSTRLAAVATGNSLAIVDLSTPTAPILARTIAVAANQLEVLDGVAYVITGASLQAYDLLTGDQHSSLSFSSGLTGLAREGSMLYLQDQTNRIHVVESVDGTGDLLLIRGSIALPYTVGSSGERKLFVAEGSLYVPADDGFQGGFATVDVKNPTAPVVLSGPDDRALAGKAIALTGSGRAVIVGNPGGVFGTNVADVINTSDPLNTGAFITRINMSARPNDVAIANGFAFVATDTGLQVVNFLPRDVNGIAPTVSIDTAGLDIDPTTPGLQIQDGSTIPIKLNLADDVLVSSVDVLVNGQVVRSDNSYPFDLRTKLPTGAANGGSNVTLQVRATDTGGNVGLSGLISLTLTPDTIAPSIIARNLNDNDLVGRAFNTILFTFSEGIELTAPVGDVLRLISPSGATITSTMAVLRNNGRQLQLSADQLPAGNNYQLQLDASRIRDGAGNLLGSTLQTISFDVSAYDSVTYGTTGSDTLQGGSSSDFISGGPKNNPASDLGADYLNGNAGDDALYGYGSNDTLFGGDGSDSLYGGSGNDALYGGNGNDSLQGEAGTDTLYGDAGNDTLDGGSGNDVLSGGTGADTYVFSKGSGQDTISNNDGEVVGTNADTILLGVGIATTGVTLTRQSDDLIISLNGSDDSLRVQGYFNTDGASIYVVENLKFADGTVWDVATIKTKVLTSTAGNDTLYGYATADTINAGDGNDIVYGNADDDVLDGGTGADNVQGGDGNDTVKGGSGNDYLYGGNGNDSLQGEAGTDTLYGDAGNDTLDGGSGNDVLSGGTGADTYVFSKGSGQDTIYNYDGEAVGTNADTILLGVGIATTGVTLTRQSDDLIISLNGSDDSLRVQGYFNTDGASIYVVENLKFADGTVWDVATIKTKVLTSTAGNDTLYGYATADTINAGDGNDIVYGNADDDVLDGGTGADNVQGGDGNDTVKGGSGNDYLYGGNGNDSLQGEAGTDTLYGDAGNDTLDGGSGNDVLSGGTGADTYVFSKGSGQDTISNNDGEVVGTNADTILLGVGIATTGVTLTRQSDDLIISLNGSDDSLRVQSYFNTDGLSSYVVENLKFADGTVWDVATIKTKVLTSTAGKDTLYGYATADTINAGDGNDTVYGLAGDDVLDGGTGNDNVQSGDGNDVVTGGSGNDYLYGGNGNDSLQGEAGTDTLYGDAGNDTLDGGSGNDVLSGGTGADTYVFSKGSGQDTIYNYDGEAAGTNADTILLGAGIATTGVTLTRQSDDLIISLNGSDDSLRVQGYFYTDGASSYVVENLKFADGTVWDVATIKTKVLTSTAGNDTLYGYATADTINAGDGNDIVYGNADDDVLDGGTGADNVQGGDGNDTVKGGSGNDYLYGGNGNDSLQGEAGTDTLYGDAGNDTLDGGSGNDVLSGGTGADTYVFSKGSGQDTISNNDGEVVGTNADTILLGVGIATTGVTLTRQSDDLIISLNGSDDSLRVQSYFNTDGASIYVVENLKFADGTVWDVATIKTKVLTSTAGKDTLYGYATADTINAGDGNDTVYGLAGDDVLDGGTGNDNVQSGDGNDVVTGGSGNDYLYGGNGNDSLQGEAGTDTLYGDAGNDTLDGGSGNDVLSGGTGADTYVFSKGSGQDTIYNYDGEAAGTNADTILLGAGIATTGVTLTRQSDDLIISLNGSDDSLRVQGYFYTDGASSYVVENLKFADGTVWDVATIKTKVLTSTAGNDTLYGYATADTINAGDGNDIVYGNADDDVLDGGTGADNVQGGDGNDTVKGGSGNDYLYGGNGNDSLQGEAGTDTLYGDAGNDTLDGGSGNDVLSGGTGADTYVFSKGSGQDTISNNDGEVVGTNADTILLGVGIATTGVTLTRQSDDLIISLNGSDDSLRVQSYFNTDGLSSYVVENLKFADGTVWDVATIKTKVLTSTAGKDTLYGYATADTINAGDGNDTVYGLAGDDVLDGGTGNDNVQSGDGNDVVTGGSGNDYLYGGNGNDSLQGEAGTDTLYGDAGNDTLDGGSGNDVLSGGTGADTYVFSKGSGQDTIYNYDGEAAGTNADTILLGAGIATTGVTLTRQSDDLIISLNGSDDSLRVQGYFYTDGASSYVVENLKFADGTVWNYATVKANLSTATPPASITINGTSANETLTGGLGNDTVYGNAGNDTLDGGSGNDTLEGGAGNDTYLFGKGSGKDIISAYDGTVGKVDLIQLGAGVLTTDVVLKREGDTLVLSINGSTDTLRVDSYFSNDATYGYQVEQIKFADGTIWDVDAVKTKALIATNENDTLYGYASADTLSGLSGDDIVYARAGNDTLDGGAGDDQLYGEDGDDLILSGTQNDRLDGGNGADTLQGQDGDDMLYGQAGNDTLDGGSGNDTLDGGAGNDTYLFGKGSGKDTISAYDGMVGKVDLIQLGAGVLTTDVVLKREGDTLVLSINGSTDTLRVNNYFSNDATYGYQVEQIKFADGTIWDVDAVKTKALIATNENDTLYGYASADTLSGLSGDDIVYASAGNDTLDGGAGDDQLYGEDGDDLILSGTQNDRLDGGNGADTLQGQDGDDTLYGQAGNDTLDGGSGNDTLDGGAGNDTYLFGKGSGKDIISAYDGTVGKVDLIQLGAGVLTTDVVLKREGDTLVLSINGSTDTLRVNNYFSNDATYGYQVEQIKFADGTIWDVDAVKTKALIATNENDTLYGYASADTLSGLSGDDIVYARAGNDTLDGGAGDDQLYGEDGDDLILSGTQNDRLDGGNGADTLQGQDGDDMLYGQAGNDTLDGGSGNDTLDGGAGNDTYLFGKGSGKDIISAYDGTVGKVDLIQLGAGVLTTDVVLKREGDTLVLSINGSTDTLRVNNYFSNDATYGYQVEQIKFADGTIWDVDAVKTKALIATNENDTLYGYASADTLSGLSGDDIVYARAGNDTLDGGAGDDQLYGEDGDDLILSGTQNDRLDGGNGADTLQGQDGDDTLYGQAGNDTLDGGSGNDTLDGGAGNDTYLFGKGSGKDTISAYDGMVGKVDLIQLGAGVLTTDVVLKREGDTLVLSINGSTDTLRVNNYFSNDATYGYQVEQIKFADGTIWDVDAVKTKALIATNENDTLYGYASADTLSGLSGDDIVYARAGNDTLDGGAGDDQLYAEDGDDLILGGTQNDRLDGGNGADTLQGQDGDDTLYGQAGNDTLDGGSGNDTLDGGAGNDTYLFGKGSGKDTISAYDGMVGKVDLIQLGAGVLTTDVVLKREGDTLVLSINGSTDTLRVNNYFSNDATYGYQVEQIKFADGTIWDVDAVKTKALIATNENDTLYGYASADTLSGLSGDDIVYASAGNDTLDGGAGDDQLYAEDGDDLILSGTQNDRLDGGNGADTLQGQDGDDMLYGQAGNDTLDGGSGNDTLDGGAGNDTYLFGKGSGKDIISAYDGTVGKVDLIQLGAGVLTTDVVLKREGDTLVLSINGSTDTLRVNNYFSNDATYGYQVEQIKFADGTIWDVDAVKTKALIATNENDTLYGYASADTLSGLSGDDIVYARAGNDTLDGGAGDDQLYGEDGDDLILSGTQNDRLDGGNGADTLQGQDGDDTLYGQAGNDTLDGGSGNDTLEGGAGDDLINGGLNADRLTGGSGSDKFSYQNPNEGADVITDFNGNFELIQLSAFGFGGGLVAGMDLLASGRYVENSTGLATSAVGTGQFIFLRSSNQLYWDGDGEGGLSASLLSTFSNPVNWSPSGLQVV